jgi:hypothetical protein
LRANRTYPRRKEPGVCRIALLGDSFFFGFEVGFEDTFGQNLERVLRRAGNDVEVLNFAVSGFGTAEMLQSFDGQVRAYSPDLVIAEWHSSDLDDNVRSQLYQMRDGRLQRGATSYLPATDFQAQLLGSPGFRWLAEHSQLYNGMRDRISTFMQRLLAKMRTKPADAPAGDAATSDDSDLRIAFKAELSEALLRELRRHVEAAGSRFLVVDIPRRIDRTTFKSNFELLPRALTNDPAYISPVRAFRAAAGAATKIYWETGQGHLSPIGNRIVADVVAVSAAPMLHDCRHQP